VPGRDHSIHPPFFDRLLQSASIWFCSIQGTRSRNLRSDSELDYRLKFSGPDPWPPVRVRREPPAIGPLFRLSEINGASP
jgi:hypothetical protein